MREEAFAFNSRGTVALEQNRTSLIPLESVHFRMSMYIRLKRKSQTVFLHVEPSNTFLQLKQRIAEILSIADPTHIMLVASDKVCPFLV